MKHNKGFTLIELMIVVAIIGIIAMFAVPSYQNAQRKARITEGEAALTEMQSQIEKARLTGRVPYNLIHLVDDSTKVGIQKDADEKVIAFNILHDKKIRYNNKVIYIVEYDANNQGAKKYTLKAEATGSWIKESDESCSLTLTSMGNITKADCLPPTK